MNITKIRPVGSNLYKKHHCFLCGGGFDTGGINYLVKDFFLVCPSCVDEKSDIKRRIKKHIAGLQAQIDYLEELYYTNIEKPTKEEIKEINVQIPTD